MATGSYIGSFYGSSTSGSSYPVRVTPKINDYLLFIVSSTRIPSSVGPDIGGPPELSLLASVAANDLAIISVWGATVTALPTSGTDCSYNVVMSAGVFGALMYQVTPSSGETLGVTNTIQQQRVIDSTSVSLTTAQQPKAGDVVFGHATYQSNTITFTDTDTSNGSWSSKSTVYYYGASNWSLWGQFKNVTGTGDQTYNGTFGASRVSATLVTVSAEQRTSYWGVRA